MSMYKKRDIDERLRNLGATPLYKEGWDYAVTYKGVRIPGIKVTHPGNEIPDGAVSKLAREIADIGNLNSNDVKKVLRGMRPSLDTGLNSGILTASFVLIMLIISRTKILTGNVIGNIPYSALNGLIILVVFIILGLLLLKFRKDNS